MLRAVDIAKYFINKDSDKTLFNKNTICKNGRTFYEGNARLNKFLHLAQNIYFAKHNKLLMDTSFYAYDNGAVIPDIQEHYGALINCPATVATHVPSHIPNRYQRMVSACVRAKKATIPGL